MKPKNHKPNKKSRTLWQNIVYWDVFISSLVHLHESFMLQVILTIPGLIFNPRFIAGPIMFVYYREGYDIATRYIFHILVVLGVSYILKRALGRPRPIPKQGALFKTLIFATQENNCSLPSGDSMQAGCFLQFYLERLSKNDDNFMVASVCLTMLNVILARVYFRRHYFGDTIFGIILGYFLSLTLSAIH